MTWLLEAALDATSGLTIGIFDRSVRYVEFHGHTTDPKMVLGTTVGSTTLPKEKGLEIFDAARRAIQKGDTTSLEMICDNKVWEVRVRPISHSKLGILGGVIFAWDITNRTRSVE